MPLLTTWEGMAVPFDQGMDQRALGHRLIRATEGNASPAFRWKRGQLHAAEMVGCIQIGHFRINVLPKLDTSDLERDRQFLLNMLGAAGYLSRPYIGVADVRSAASDPLEVLISEVAREMNAAIREGVPRRYEEKQEDSSTIRGRIDFSKLSSRQHCDRVSLPIRYSPLHRDNQLARCIKAIAALFHRLTRNSHSRQIFATVLAQLSDVGNLALTMAELDSLFLAHQESQWTRSINVARLLLAAQSPDPTFSGEHQAFSLLFPLQHLFERAMRRVLMKALTRSGLSMILRKDTRFLLQDTSNGQSVLRLRPDYVLGQQFDALAVADAKWKRLVEHERAHGISREDLYQLNAYLTRFKVRDAVIFVPRAKWMVASWTKSYVVPEAGKIHLIGVDVEKLVARNETQRDEAIAALSLTLDTLLVDSR